MIDVVVSTEDALALAALVLHCNSNFPIGPAGDRPGTAPTGEPYTELPAKEWYPSREAALDAAKAAFDEYAEGKTGTLFWRVKPELGQDYKNGWKFYMRLLISDKPWQPSTSSTTPTTKS